MNIGLHVRTYEIIAMANGYVMGYSPTEQNPYVTWKIDGFGTGVSLGHYFVDREEAEWDFCARAFEWFEDNVNINMIEDGEETSETHVVWDTQSIEDQPPERDLIGGLKEIRMQMKAAAQLVDEMCAEVDRLKAEQRCLNGNGNNSNND